jgi:hypothetical protein
MKDASLPTLAVGDGPPDSRKGRDNGVRLTIVVHADACLQGLGLTDSEHSEVKPIGKPELVHNPGENSGAPIT